MVSVIYSLKKEDEEKQRFPHDLLKDIVYKVYLYIYQLIYQLLCSLRNSIFYEYISSSFQYIYVHIYFIL